MKKQIAVITAVVMAALLTGCSVGGNGTPSQSADSGSSDTQGDNKAALAETSWKGTDSKSRAWTVRFEKGGDVTASIDQVPTQDLESTWELSGDSLMVNVTSTQEQSVYMMTGSAGDKQIELKEPERKFTVTLKPDSSPS